MIKIDVMSVYKESRDAALFVAPFFQLPFEHSTNILYRTQNFSRRREAMGANLTTCAGCISFKNCLHLLYDMLKRYLQAMPVIHSTETQHNYTPDQQPDAHKREDRPGSSMHTKSSRKKHVEEHIKRRRRWYRIGSMIFHAVYISYA